MGVGTAEVDGRVAIASVCCDAAWKELSIYTFSALEHTSKVMVVDAALNGSGAP